MAMMRMTSSEQLPILVKASISDSLTFGLLSTAAFGRLRWGIAVARRAWLTAGDVLNTQPIETVRASLRRNRR